MKKTETQAATVQEPAERVEVTIRKEGHTHRGKPCAVGDKIRVTPRQAEWLKEQGVI
ncbi:DUF7210 family protein [Thioalbus denitrificans]|uniref:DUF7210 domain-containing protein n=1 Tax=Thioalbus denitrificans TaxID=547122 RepID=A0A369CFR1_9GAMM|nr:hypothetical protein [Thioalbus denitrificans]RCX32078.1 hypothetical protein DFQ59_102431 [Thioalbus denitrificans]